MTVINTSYSTLEEAWGTKPRKKKSRSMRDEYVESPICELYQKRNSKVRKPYMEEVNAYNDMDGYMLGSYARNEKSRPKYKPIAINDDTNEYKAERVYEDEDDEYLSKALESVSKTRAAPIETFQDNDKLQHDKMMDLGLYVVSGTLLIFAMEQILQMGIRMKA